MLSIKQLKEELYEADEVINELQIQYDIEKKNIDIITKKCNKYEIKINSLNNLSENMRIMEGINLCHIKLLIDKMTFNGIPNSISRYTLRKDESGPLSKSSFEESTDILIKAGFAGDTEKVKGISASIICGKKGKIGSGFMDLKIDVNQLSNKIFKDDNGMVIEEKGGNATFKNYTNFI